MTNPNRSLIALIVDASGSMSHLRDATIEGITKLMGEQAGDCLVDISFFNGSLSNICDLVPLNKVDVRAVLSEYRPTGGTALYASVVQRMEQLGQRLAAMDEAERPSRCSVAIVTDGQDNASGMISASVCRAAIKHQTDVYSWQFLFLGANINAEEAAFTIGINVNAAANYTASTKGTQRGYAVLSRSIASYNAGAEAAVISEADKASLVDMSPIDVLLNTNTPIDVLNKP